MTSVLPLSTLTSIALTQSTTLPPVSSDEESDEEELSDQGGSSVPDLFRFNAHPLLAYQHNDSLHPVAARIAAKIDSAIRIDGCPADHMNFLVFESGLDSQHFYAKDDAYINSHPFPERPPRVKEWTRKLINRTTEQQRSFLRGRGAAGTGRRQRLWQHMGAVIIAYTANSTFSLAHPLEEGVIRDYLVSFIQGSLIRKAKTLVMTEKLILLPVTDSDDDMTVKSGAELHRRSHKIIGEVSASSNPKTLEDILSDKKFDAQEHYKYSIVGAGFIMLHTLCRTFEWPVGTSAATRFKSAETLLKKFYMLCDFLGTCLRCLKKAPTIGFLLTNPTFCRSDTCDTCCTLTMAWNTQKQRYLTWNDTCVGPRPPRPSLPKACPACSDNGQIYAVPQLRICTNCFYLHNGDLKALIYLLHV